MEENRAIQETRDMAEFNKLITKVAELPKEQREKVAIFAQGILAATAGSAQTA